MSGEFNIHAARRIEARQLAALREASAVQRSEDIYALRRANAARGGAVTGGLLTEELRIICAAAETMIDTAIANRKELARSAPELLIEQPYLKEFHRVFNEMADGVEIAVQQLHASPSQAGHFPPAAREAILRDAQGRAKTLKGRIDIDIQKMALEGTLAMDRKKQPQQQVTVFNAPVGNVAQNCTNVNQTANMGVSADVVRLIEEVTAHLDDLKLEPRQKQRAEAQIAALRVEVAGNDPDPGTVTQAGRSLRNITEGAIGSLLATAAQPGIWQWIHETMKALF
jgi:hypothetical protein